MLKHCLPLFFLPASLEQGRLETRYPYALWTRAEDDAPCKAYCDVADLRPLVAGGGVVGPERLGRGEPPLGFRGVSPLRCIFLGSLPSREGS